MPMTARRQPDQAVKKWPNWWPWAVVGILLLVLCLGWFLLPLREWVEALQSWLLGLGLWGVLIFTLILTVVTFLPAPDWPLPIAAGYVYGFWAFPLTYASIAFASMLAFLAARYLLRDKIRSLLIRRPKYRKLDRAVAEDGWQVVVLMRLSPIVPFNLQNYALGVTAIPFLQFLPRRSSESRPGSRSTSTSVFSAKGWEMDPASSTGCCSASVCWRPSPSRSWCFVRPKPSSPKRTPLKAFR
jgi:uncharacterized membrane protein YdjX (TVP38/TMEM64 family)